MLYNLKIEWLKIKNYRTFWILAGLFVISIFGINYIGFAIEQETMKKAPEAGMILGTSRFLFPDVWGTIAYLSSFLLFIPGLLMIISITNEYSFKTHRQNIIDGWSRLDFIYVKLADAVILALGSTLIMFLAAFGFGISSGGFSSLSFSGSQYVFYFFMQALSYILIALLFGVLFKRSGIALGVFFLYAVVIENMAAGLLNRYAGGIGAYLPLESTDNLIPFPFLKNVVDQVVKRPDTTYLLIAASIYLVFYFWICKRRFQTDDL
ncbi:MAG: ABC transporter permease [Bacteroidetes bacterium]|nr:ABC transporter permease [Bacteroidota bacterium]